MNETISTRAWCLLTARLAVGLAVVAGSHRISRAEPARQALPLRPGEATTLTTGGDYYWPTYSDVDWPLAVGTAIHAQVDSANAGTTYGAVREGNEGNNVGGPARLVGASGLPLFQPGGAGTVAGDLHQTGLSVRPDGRNRDSRDLEPSATRASR